jgi:hypothetical protein
MRAGIRRDVRIAGLFGKVADDLGVRVHALFRAPVELQDQLASIENRRVGLLDAEQPGFEGVFACCSAIPRRKVPDTGRRRPPVEVTRLRPMIMFRSCFEKGGAL